MMRWDEREQELADARKEGRVDGFAWGLGVMALTIMVALKIAGVL